MDINAIVNALPQPWGGIILFVLAVVGAASTAAAYLPASDGSGIYGLFRKFLDFVGHNFLNAKNQ